MNCALGHEKVVDDDNLFSDTPSMFKRDHRVPVQLSGVERYFIFSRIPPSADDTSIIVLVEFSYIPYCCVFFMSSGTLKMALPGQSNHLMFTHQSLINDKITALSQMEVTASRTCTFPLPEKFYLA